MYWLLSFSHENEGQRNRESSLFDTKMISYISVVSTSGLHKSHGAVQTCDRFQDSVLGLCCDQKSRLQRICQSVLSSKLVFYALLLAYRSSHFMEEVRPSEQMQASGAWSHALAIVGHANCWSPMQIA